MFDKIVNTTRRIPAPYFLLIIIFIGFILRTAAWYHFGTHLMAGGGSEYDSLSMSLAHGDWNMYFSNERFHQPVYALLLVPIYSFHFPPETYVFWLHHFLSLGTICIVYLIAKKAFGIYCGLLSAFFISINAMIIFWFPWGYSDTAFHFFLALFGLGAVNLFIDKKPINYVFFFFSCLLCLLTRPEGIFVFFTTVLILLHIHLTQKLSSVKIIYIFAGIIFLLSSLFVTTMFLHKKSREFFFSMTQISRALYVSSKISTNSPQEQQQVYYVSMGEEIKKARSRPDFVSSNYALSMYGLNFIKEHPFTWLKMYIRRFASVVFPSVFSPFWSTTHRIYSFSMSFILVIGSILALFFNDSQRFLALVLTLMALSLPLSISLFQREVDYRVPLSMFILFATVAPYGWVKFYAYLTKRQAHD